MIIRDDLLELNNTNIDDYYCAACHDSYPKARRKIGIKKPLYTSNGIILMNLQRWRDADLESKFVDFIISRDGILPNFDQDALNCKCLD